MLSACSRKKNRFTSRAYHNTTTRYNYFFNAREIKRETERALYDQHQDDFSEIIPLFIYPSEEQAKALYPDMDKIIEKTSTAIDRHSMYLKKEEHNRWIDDSYMLMGIARFYKQEYFVGEEIFEYIAKAYKKQDERFLGLIWLARTHIELGNMNKAESYLTLIDEQGIPKQYNSDYNALYADFFIKKRNIDEAIHRLEKALKTTKKKKEKTRYNYVLAQLWLKKKEYGKASDLFTTVIKLKPRYDMLFNAKISRAMSFEPGSEKGGDIKKMLTKMVKDSKNEEFLDQIYYALADIAFKEGDEPLGINYLQKSAAASVSNNKQKALSYLRLGEIFYQKPNYIKSQAYYDSCLTVLPEDYDRYESIYTRSKALNNLVENILIVQKEDSLQKMVNDVPYRQEVINALIKKAKEEDEAKLAEEAEFNVLDNNNSPNINANVNNTGKWYFYNQTTLGFGFTDFKKNWGNRKLEDDWRRSNKESIATFDDELAVSDSATTDSTGTVINPKTTEAYYLKFLPLTDSTLTASHNKIIEALYKLGNIYREDFQDYKQATKSFENLIERYDTCRYKLPSWYNLYRISLLTDNDKMKAKYKRLILDEYPESEYARIIQDPAYNKVTRENRKRVDNYYSIVFELYRDRKYEKVLIRCETAKSIFADNHIQDKFDLLAAMSIGHTSPIDTFKLALNNIILNHSETESAKEAQRILDLIKKGIKVDVGEEESNSTVPYKHKFSAEFHLVVIIPGTDKRTNKYKVDISNFNAKYYSEKTFSVSNIFIDPTKQLIIVKKMDTYEEAIDYYKSFKFNKDNLKDIIDKKYNYFLISKENFVLFYKNKDVKGYLDFFKKNFEVD